MLAQNSMKEIKELKEEEFKAVWSNREGHVFAASIQYLTDYWLDHIALPVFTDDLDTAIYVTRSWSKRYANQNLKDGRWKYVFGITIHINDNNGVFYSEHYVPEFTSKNIQEFNTSALEKHIEFLTNVVLADHKSKLEK